MGGIEGIARITWQGVRVADEVVVRPSWLGNKQDIDV